MCYIYSCIYTVCMSPALQKWISHFINKLILQVTSTALDQSSHSVLILFISYSICVRPVCELVNCLVLCQMLHVLLLWLLHGMFPGWVAGIDSLSSAQNSISFRFLGCQNEIAREGIQQKVSSFQKCLTYVEGKIMASEDR